eukprot:10670-Heterococcus_DN1.PRE.2
MESIQGSAVLLGSYRMLQTATTNWLHVDIANENSQSQTVFSTVMITLNVVMVLAAVAQLGLIAAPACTSSRTKVQQLLQRLRHRNDNNSGSNDGDTTAADTELASCCIVTVCML